MHYDEENLYSYDYQRQRSEEISYYNFEEFVKQLKLDDYKNQMEKLAENLGDNTNPSLDMLLDLLKELPN